MGFNEAQTKAICHKNGPAMVLAAQVQEKHWSSQDE